VTSAGTANGVADSRTAVIDWNCKLSVSATFRLFEKPCTSSGVVSGSTNGVDAVPVGRLM
jgi:hypothetical protein